MIFFLALLFLFPIPLRAETLSDGDFLEMVQERAFRYFEQNVHRHTGLTHDGALNHDAVDSRAPASIASVGFALSAYPVGVEHGWMGRGTAQELTKRTLEFFLDTAEQKNGFFYHFLDPETGKRANRSELSTIDTALFLAGVLFAAEYYGDPEIRNLAQKLYDRVDFFWMLNGGKTPALAWSPETGFHRRRWDHFDESLLLYVLAIGSSTHPIPPESWKEVLKPVGSYHGHRLIAMPPLFTHQYPHIWIDLKDKNDGFADYFKNSVNATLANRDFCIDQSSKFSGYGPDLWGLTASDGPSGYKAYGAPPGWGVVHDGTIAPTGCGASIVFTPKESIACLRNIYEKYGDKMWGQFGFADAMNLDKKWTSDKVLAIDQGAMLLMIENYRTGLIWKYMDRNESVRNALAKIGFRSGTTELPWPDPPEYRAPYVPNGIKPDALLKDWPQTAVIRLKPDTNREFGSLSGPADLSAKIRFAWDEKNLYFVAQVTDDNVLVKRTGKHIWRDDLLELYVDPDGDGFFWNSSGDYQIGFRPAQGDIPVESWSWFQGGESLIESGKAREGSYVDGQGYVVEGAVRWDALGIQPKIGLEVRLSPAIHDIDPKGDDKKIVWFMRNEEEFQRFVLGKIILAKGVRKANE